MRRLYLVPIVHMTADMGSAAPALDAEASVHVGVEPWQEHKEVVSRFWDTIGRFFDSIDVNGLRVYQDGMVAGGAAALEILREGAGKGSKNYEIVTRLVERGAILMKTEDLALVRQEHAFIRKMTQSRSQREREVAAHRYRLAQGRLLKQRDGFIAAEIARTLGEGDTGILFVGAYHDVAARLPGDISLAEVKDPGMVREYHQAVAAPRADRRRLGELVEYLVSPVPSSVSPPASP